MSSNDVTIIAFRDGSMSLNGFALDSAEVAALRAHFAAETATALRALQGASGVIEQVRAWRNYYLVKPTDPEWDRQATWDVEKLDAILAAYPETRAAERMPEDVQALLAKAQKFVELRGFTQATNLVDELALALEAAYSQKGKAHEGA